MSSRSSSLSPPKSHKKLGFDEYATERFQNEILEPNSIVVAENRLSPEAWSDLAFSLGISAKHGRRPTAATQKLAQRMSKRRVPSAAQTTDFLNSFIESLASECTQISQAERSTYHHDPVPTADSLKNTTRRLPVPKPSISVGYRKGLFSLAHDELQEGLISGPSGDPCDLKRISQPISGHFWPFFVVEVSEQSMTAARQASAISAATCNNALDLLAGASADDGKDWNSQSFIFDKNCTKSFSLSVYGKTASLSAHSIDCAAYHTARIVETYQLNDQNDVASLAHRLHSIIVWGRFNRLGEIIATLDQLNKKVHGNSSHSPLDGGMDDFDPACLKGWKLTAPRRPDRVKVALRAGLPSWLVG